MKEKKEHNTKPLSDDVTDNKAATDGYPVYPVSEDIYNKDKEEEDIDPEDITKLKTPDDMDDEEQGNEKDFDEDKSGDDLDVPGVELDDDMEDIGSEDEENNYYSLGGDDHNDLDEDRD